jgi:large subunit ribosomal protein L18
MGKISPRLLRKRRRTRIRAKVKGIPARPRLNVFRSLNHIYAQIIDDAHGVILAAASSRDTEMRTELSEKTKTAVAGLVGELVAKRALERGISQVVFDRGGYQYHGRVKALAEGAREGGLKF